MTTNLHDIIDTSIDDNAVVTGGANSYNITEYTTGSYSHKCEQPTVVMTTASSLPD